MSRLLANWCYSSIRTMLFVFYFYVRKDFSIFFISFFFLRKGDCYVQCLIWVCLDSWKLDYPTFSYKWTLRACLEVLAGECSYSCTLDRRPALCSSWEGGPPRPRAQLREGSTWIGEGGRGHLCSQPDQWNRPWGDRCHSQIALTSWHFLLYFTLPYTEQSTHVSGCGKAWISESGEFDPGSNI